MSHLVELLIVTLSIFQINAWQCKKFHTSWMYEGPGSGLVHYLDKHWVRCDIYDTKYGTGILRSAQLQRRNFHDIRYEYECCDVGRTNGKVVWKNTHWANLGYSDPYKESKGVSIETLAQIPMKCDNGFGIQTFKLQTKQGYWRKLARYRYSCIQAQTTNRLITHSNEGSGLRRFVAYLDRVKISCPKSLHHTGYFYPIIKEISAEKLPGMHRRFGWIYHTKCYSI